MIRFQKIILVAAAAVAFTACKKDVDPVFIIPPSTGAQVQLNGIAGSEAGSCCRQFCLPRSIRRKANPCFTFRLGFWFLLWFRFQGNIK